MLNQEIQKVYHWFSKYLKEFYAKYPQYSDAIRLKEDHTLRVCRNIQNIGNSLNLDKTELNLAYITALLHDIGRFQQYTQYGTFNDRESENHALLGLKILKDYKVLADLKNEHESVITQAISLHNIWQMPANITPIVNKFTCLIRDADKLDILALFAKNYTQNDFGFKHVLETGLPDSNQVSPTILDCFLANKTCNYADVQNQNDRKVLQLTWIYDINYPYTFNKIVNNRYMDTILNSLPSSKESIKIKTHLHSYIKFRLFQNSK